ncbi:MAG: prepilin-type N-terminal cleavage/methylation domain-containing protein [Chthoniobacteraceae bacterium]
MNLSKIKSPPKCIRPEGGFTLIELIMVIAIMVVLLALTIPAFVGVSSGRDIVKAVDTAQSMASIARQQAMTKGTMVALLFSGTSNVSASNSQEFLLLQANINTSGSYAWTPSSAAVRIPKDVQITAPSFYSPSAGTSGVPSLPTTIAFGSKNVTDFSYVMFYSDGSVASLASGPTINLQKTTESGTNPDYEVVIPSASGRAKVSAMK